jgi:hypothetical protein
MGSVVARLPGSAIFALVAANARYWTSVAPVVRAQLARWERRARAIPDPALRATALEKLREERFNAEVAATLATLAPRAQRARTAEAIVALQVAYDYLDGLTEQPAADPLRSGRQLSVAFTDALPSAHRREPGDADGRRPLPGGEFAPSGKPTPNGEPSSGEPSSGDGEEPVRGGTHTPGGEFAPNGEPGDADGRRPLPGGAHAPGGRLGGEHDSAGGRESAQGRICAPSGEPAPGGEHGDASEGMSVHGHTYAPSGEPASDGEHGGTSNGISVHSHTYAPSGEPASDREHGGTSNGMSVHDHTYAPSGEPVPGGEHGGTSDGMPGHGHTYAPDGEPASDGEPVRTGDYFREHPSDDGGYLAALSAATNVATAQLPAWSAVSEVAHASAALCAEAQVRVHAAPATGAAQLEQWARAQAAGTALQWREHLAGAVSSVLAVHALIAAAANERTTPAQAAAIDSAYLSISALSTMLDSGIDYEEDCRGGGEPWNVRHYDSPAILADAVTAVIGDARAGVQTLPDAAHHALMLVGVAAYYASAPQAEEGIAATLTGRVRDELGPSLGPTLAVMRAWRRAKRMRRGAERLWWGTQQPRQDTQQPRHGTQQPRQDTQQPRHGSQRPRHGTQVLEHGADIARLSATGKRRMEPPASVSVDEQTDSRNRELTASAGPT